VFFSLSSRSLKASLVSFREMSNEVEWVQGILQGHLSP
jgi:hypothetical protein